MPQPHPTSSVLLRAGALSAAIAVALSLGLFAVGRAADASFLVTLGGQPPLQVRPPAVALFSLLPLVAALAVTWLAARRGPGAVRVLQVAAAAVALVSLIAPLSADSDAATKVLLATMHVVVGGAYVVAAERVRVALLPGTDAAGASGAPAQPAARR